MPFFKAKQEADRRRASRQRMLHGCRVASADGSYAAKCEMLDFSPSGARIRVSDERPLPQMLHLLDFQSRLTYEARVVWRKAPEFGLEFRKAFRFAEAPSPALSKLIQDELRT